MTVARLKTETSPSEQRFYPGRAHRGALKSVSVYAACGAVAFCSMAYELCLAQTVSVLYGDTFQRYCVSIGFFLAGLSIGAWLVQTGTHLLARLPEPLRSWAAVFVILEVALCLLGAWSPAILVLLDSGVNHAPQLVSALTGVVFSFDLSGVGLMCAYLISGLIGVLSGMEIPVLAGLLSEWSGTPTEFGHGDLEGAQNVDQLTEEAVAREGALDRDRSKNVAASSGQTVVLGLDYLGSSLGAVSFPLFLFPTQGLLHASLGIGLVNGVLAVVFCGLFICTSRARRRGWGTALGLLSVATLAVQAAGLLSARALEDKLADLAFGASAIAPFPAEPGPAQTGGSSGGQDDTL